MTKKKIAILGWGSLMWDKQPEFDEQHEEEWQYDGPCLKIEFSRVSKNKKRKNALTLVLDLDHGKCCRVAYTLSRRQNPDDTICDLRCREGTTLENVGFWFADKSKVHSHHPKPLEVIQKWASEKKLDVVVWTGLESNFQKEAGKPFSVENALSYVQALRHEGRMKAVEYVRCAPEFFKTPLREALQSKPWFQ
jgi:cation transport regulator ChaC